MVVVPCAHDSKKIKKRQERQTHLMSATEQPSSPGRGRRAASDDREAAPGKEPTIIISSPIPSPIPSGHLLQIHGMESSPYASSHDSLYGPVEVDEEQQRARFFWQRVVQGANGSTPAMGSEWEVLVKFIDDLACYTSLRPWDTLSLTTQESLRQLFGGSARPYYDAKYASFALIQAWMWHALDDNLFSDPDKWATPKWNAYGTLCASLRHHHAGTLDSAITLKEHGEPGVYAESEFHYWRMLTTRIMMNGWEEIGMNTALHTSVHRLADRLMGKLAEIIDEAKKPLGTYEDKVRCIARSAVSTDLQIIRAWAHVMIAWRLPNMANAAAMKGHPLRKSPAIQNYDDMFETKDGHIDFVVSPGIFESGESRTQFYEGRWMYPIRVAITEELDDPAARFRSKAHDGFDKPVSS
ncbi:hypothetical protein B0T25DRAFT_277988 [Lasiosphaeria hispida]|uniref:Uncharacterized protein n=1 Tax=Lasiosphaeria hispida TaxID=260671 RepID=A0AAJ0HBP2_9PEZI|nr:hypothetical protein B0T25DRAFT_277988 [Lasiosphaeria hispida]